MSGSGGAVATPGLAATTFTGLISLLENEHRQLVSAHTRILSGWNQLTTMLPAVHGCGNAGDIAGIRLLADREEVLSSVAELYESDPKKLRGTQSGTGLVDEIRTWPAGLPKTGAVYQLIYQASRVDVAPGARSANGGEQVRLRDHVPVTMLHAEGAVALVATDPTARSALQVRSPAILAALADWFDLMWTAPDTVRFPAGPGDSDLTPVAKRILTMMPFDDDESIARKLNLSVSTIRRHIKTIYLTLGTNNRFAAGMAAAKLGLV